MLKLMSKSDLMRNYLINTLVLIACSVVCSCNADSKDAINKDGCRSYVDFYLSFHEGMTNDKLQNKKTILNKMLHTHPEDSKSQNALQNLVVAYVEHETEIKEISEYYASCSKERQYASMWFKIIDANPRFTRLYVVVNEGKKYALKGVGFLCK